MAAPRPPLEMKFATAQRSRDCKERWRVVGQAFTSAPNLQLRLGLLKQADVDVGHRARRSAPL